MINCKICCLIETLLTANIPFVLLLLFFILCGATTCRLELLEMKRLAGPHTSSHYQTKRDLVSCTRVLQGSVYSLQWKPKMRRSAWLWYVSHCAVFNVSFFCTSHIFFSFFAVMQRSDSCASLLLKTQSATNRVKPVGGARNKDPQGTVQGKKYQRILLVTVLQRTCPNTRHSENEAIER